MVYILTWNKKKGAVSIVEEGTDVKREFTEAFINVPSHFIVDGTTSARLRVEGQLTIDIDGAAHIDTLTLVDDTIDTLAARFEEGLAAWRTEHPSGIIVGLFGMGDDGHTAGIFPMPEDLEAFADCFQSDRLVVGYRAPETATIPLRVTVTLTGIRSFACGFAYVCGGQKRDNLYELRYDASPPLHILPAGIWRDLPSVGVAKDIVG